MHVYLYGSGYFRVQRRSRDEGLMSVWTSTIEISQALLYIGDFDAPVPRSPIRDSRRAFFFLLLLLALRRQPNAIPYQKLYGLFKQHTIGDCNTKR